MKHVKNIKFPSFSPHNSLTVLRKQILTMSCQIIVFSKLEKALILADIVWGMLWKAGKS